MREPRMKVGCKIDMASDAMMQAIKDHEEKKITYMDCIKVICKYVDTYWEACQCELYSWHIYDRKNV